MKLQIQSLVQILLLFGVISFTMSSCLKDECNETRTFIEQEALYANPSQFRVDASAEEVRALNNPGKIYFFNNYILINEKYEGVHIIDNNDPSNPSNIGFLSIPGNIDVSIRGNFMYADSYVDLLTIDITDIFNPVTTCRDEEVFRHFGLDPSRGYLVDWLPTENRVEVDCRDPNFGSDQFDRGGNVFVLEDNAGGIPTAGGGETSTGEAGSFARFSIVKDHLYVIDVSSLTAFDLNNPSKPEQKDQVSVSWNIETLFYYEDHLFIGAQDGMFIYDISNPAMPSYVSQFNHARACDPVFVQNDIAYITLRDGTRCQNFTNQLDVVDVSNITSPKLIASYEMDNPHGVSVRDNNLFICEGTHGLKVFDASNLTEIDDNKLDHVKDIDAYDVISLSSDHLLMIGLDGLYQFDTSDPKDLEQISFIEVNRN